MLESNTSFESSIVSELGRRNCTKTVESCPRTKTQITVTEGFSVLTLFEMAVGPDYALSTKKCNQGPLSISINHWLALLLLKKYKCTWRKVNVKASAIKDLPTILVDTPAIVVTIPFESLTSSWRLNPDARFASTLFSYSFVSGGKCHAESLVYCDWLCICPSITLDGQSQKETIKSNLGVSYILFRYLRHSFPNDWKTISYTKAIHYKTETASIVFLRIVTDIIPTFLFTAILRTLADLNPNYNACFQLL